MKRIVCFVRLHVVALIATVSLSGLSQNDCSTESSYRLYNILPRQVGNEKQIAADAIEYMQRTGCDIVLYSLTLHPEGFPAIEKAKKYIASYRELKRELEGSGVRLGVLVQSILGHWPRVDKKVESWQRSINIKGKAVRFCPDDPGFAAYIEQVFTMIAETKPSFILTDDDVRAYSHDAECFCPKHIAEFNRRRGTSYSEDEVRQRVKLAKQDDPDYVAFFAIQREMMGRLVKRIRSAIDAVDSSIPAGICVSGEETFLVEPMAKAIAARGQRPVMRCSDGSYAEKAGCRAWVWSDYAWKNREYLEKCPKSVLQSNWYYDDDCVGFDVDRIPEAKRGYRPMAALFANLEKAGFEQVPCGSNWVSSYRRKNNRNADEVIGELVRHCRKTVAPERLKGFLMTSWNYIVDEESCAFACRGMDLLADALKA